MDILELSEKPRVTWLLPVRNGMPYLPDTLASIETQTYRNWEILVWDDGSTDGTLEELHKWIPARLPGRILSGQSLGIGGALAKLVEVCATEFCARIDADDINLPQRLERQVAYLSSHPQVAALGSWMYRINEQGDRYRDTYRFPSDHANIVLLLLTETAMGHPSILFRRSAILELGNYQALPKVEDYDLWLRVAASSYKLANLPEFLVEYRIRSNSETQGVRRDNTIRQRMNSCLYSHCETVFGCSAENLRLLMEYQHPNPVRQLIHILIFLERTQGSRWVEQLLSEAFSRVAKTTLTPRQRSSQIMLSLLEILPSTLVRRYWRLAHRLLLRARGNALV
jgi:glycosyltransferase involved in cell wall biosynthesis